MQDAFCHEPQDRSRSRLSFFIGCCSLIGLVIVASVQADRENNTADNQFWVHQTGAFIGFAGQIVYMYIDSFYSDLRLLKIVPGYVSPYLWKQRITQLAGCCFLSTMVTDLIQSQVICSIF